MGHTIDAIKTNESSNTITYNSTPLGLVFNDCSRIPCTQGFPRFNYNNFLFEKVATQEKKSIH